MNLIEHSKWNQTVDNLIKTAYHEELEDTVTTAGKGALIGLGLGGLTGTHALLDARKKGREAADNMKRGLLETKKALENRRAAAELAGNKLGTKKLLGRAKGLGIFGTMLGGAYAYDKYADKV